MLTYTGAQAQFINDGEDYEPVYTDTVEVSKQKPQGKVEEAYIVMNQPMTIFVNEDVTTHVIMPEAVKMVDISTKRVAGDQCTDNMVRIKPVERMYDHELAGTITLIGERNVVQYKMVYVSRPEKASTLFEVSGRDVNNYINPEVTMSESDMARFAYQVFNSKKKFYNITKNLYGIKAQINNIYAIDNYFFVDFSLYNKTNIKFDIDEIRIKLTDKKQSKATNSQTIELTPVWALNKATSFQKGYRNVIVIDKLTFPNEKVLKLEISERQISGRAISIPISYSSILHADSFNRALMGD